MTLWPLQEDWFWTAIAAAVAALSVPISLTALRQSAKALRVNIPAPDVNWRGDEVLSVVMRDEHEQLFGIAELRAVNGSFREMKVVRSDKGYDGHDIVPSGPDMGRKVFNPPVPLATIFAYIPRGSGVRIKIVSRAEASVAAWIYFRR